MSSTRYELLRSGTGVSVLSPAGTLPITMLLAIGRNYAEHAKEQGAAVPDAPMVFTKNLASACLSGDDIVIPPVARDPKFGGPQVDFEGELAVVIGPGPTGTGPRDCPIDGALSYVLGYCVANDVSARWWQKSGSGGQFFRGKSFDTFCPLGPWVVPAEQIADPQALRIQTKVSGQVMQDGTTRDMMFSVAALISDLSRGMTILPGTVILTGTPSGVGMSRTPPIWLQEGDIVEVTIDQIGTLRNRVRHG
jgi:2-keto-4-pentenoate hydratase/2-oxohepta-3-ene-1,7-dioic acid hydratase in catechol pathway